MSYVSGRSTQRQSSIISSLLAAALKSKKPVFLVASKCDQCTSEGRAEWERLLARKELKASAAQNVQTVSKN